MAKTKKINSKDYNLSAKFFRNVANYQGSRQKIYDELEKFVYNEITKSAVSGNTSLNFPLKIMNLSFEYSWQEYKDIFIKLQETLRRRGFTVNKCGNYYRIVWTYA